MQIVKVKRSKRPKSTDVTSEVTVGSLVPQPHGGALRYGGTNKGGTGRPKDEIRQKLRNIAAGKGMGFLSELLDGKVKVDFVGVCAKCGTETKPDGAAISEIFDKIAASVDHRLKANEQALKYGVGTQTETLSEDDGKALIGKTLGRFVDLVRAHGTIDDATLNSFYTQALEGLE